MNRPRIIPVLLLKDRGLVKSIKFTKHRYVGDPINAVKIFNDKEADELVFLDIQASKNNKLISLDFVEKVGEEANMPFAVGGGIKSVDDIRKILERGAEKVIINTSTIKNPALIKSAADTFGSSTIVVCIDFKKNVFGKHLCVFKNGTRKSKYNPIYFAKKIEDLGAGEIIVQSVDLDGTYQGYNTQVINDISKNVKIPVVALGGANNYGGMISIVKDDFASAAAAGSIFVYHGPRKAVLINYPMQDIKKEFIF